MVKPKIQMYSTTWCPYCERARQLLGSKNAAFEDIDIEAHPDQRAQMNQRSGRQTVPQIFIGAQHVGGCDDLLALDQAGGLDSLLAGH